MSSAKRIILRSAELGGDYVFLTSYGNYHASLTDAVHAYRSVRRIRGQLGGGHELLAFEVGGYEVGEEDGNGAWLKAIESGGDDEVVVNVSFCVGIGGRGEREGQEGQEGHEGQEGQEEEQRDFVSEMKKPLLSSYSQSDVGELRSFGNQFSFSNNRAGRASLEVEGRDLANFMNEILASTSRGRDVEEHRKGVIKSTAKVLQYRILTHLAAERLYLVWQRCSITLISGAFTLLQIAMNNERDVSYICEDDDGGDEGDDEPGGDDEGGGGGDDDCRGDKIRIASKTRAFYTMFGCGCVLFTTAVCLSYLGPLYFQKTKNWLHGYGGARVVLLDENAMNTVLLCMLFICCATYLGFYAMGIYIVRDVT
ncbi:hypothetical protein TrCOL_g2423 [Triparma columacea]|uniref:DUF202 domain-containing protein n=1 Tax=Triparma columacea TaxID=722753 RepID=A0A9W7GMR0_9STRA|nr:hypothetical protein TrCOL_g2423 [Triparma columacea]